MNEDKKQNIKLKAILIVLILIALFLGWVYILKPMSDSYELEIEIRDSCLEEIAIRECESRDLEYQYYFTDFSNDKFSCSRDSRSSGYKGFNFYKDEIEDCEKSAENGRKK